MKATTKVLFKKAIIFSLCLLPVALIGGFLTGIYTFEHSGSGIQEMILEQLGDRNIFLVVTTLQSALYAFVTGVLGYFLAHRLGLIRSRSGSSATASDKAFFGFEARLLKRTVPVIILCGILFACDYFVFGNLIPEVAADYKKGISAAYFFSSITYGAVVEELLLRWFFMSLLAFVLWKIFARKHDSSDIPASVFVASNIIAAVLFAAGHIPATIAFFGELSAPILFRCFLLNGAFALLFGRYYRKYGIQYAMLAHFGLHFVSKLILMFIV